jgi:alkane 1-monooxygenase
VEHSILGGTPPRSPAPGISRVTGRAAPYLLALLLPLGTTAFLLSGKRAVALAWLGVLASFAWLDERLDSAREEPPAPLSGRLLDALLYGLAALQFVHLGLLASQVARHGVSAVDSGIAIALVGAGSAYSALVVSHELIHRGRALPRRIGRALLWTLLYDRFFTEHLRGHHARVGTHEDALAVQTGERFAPYLFRSWRAELRSAFSIEARRLGGHRGVRVLLRNAVVLGIMAETGLAVMLTASRGPAALLAFVVQAALANVIISAVNYLQHWGLSRERRKVGEADSWDSTAPLSRYVLLGLPLHADHHVHAAQPFPRLRLRASSPRLPHGYFVMVALVLFCNDKARALLTEALRRSIASSEPLDAIRAHHDALV